MRALAVLALLLVLATPAALAQVTERMTPPGEAIAPMGRAVQIPITIEVQCGPEAAPGGVHVQYSVTKLPPWAQAVLSPTADQMDYARCAQSTAVFHAIASVTASQDAPAFT